MMCSREGRSRQSPASVEAERDPAVGVAFHGSQLLVAGPWAGALETTGLGHMFVDDPAWAPGSARGTYTHFVELNASPALARFPTTYANVVRRGASCLPEPGMLAAARGGWRPDGPRSGPTPRWDFRDLDAAGSLGRVVDVSTAKFAAPTGRAPPSDCPVNKEGALRSRAQLNVQFGVGL